MISSQQLLLQDQSFCKRPSNIQVSFARKRIAGALIKGIGQNYCARLSQGLPLHRKTGVVFILPIRPPFSTLTKVLPHFNSPLSISSRKYCKFKIQMSLCSLSDHERFMHTKYFSLPLKLQAKLVCPLGLGGVLYIYPPYFQSMWVLVKYTFLSHFLIIMTIFQQGTHFTIRCSSVGLNFTVKLNVIVSKSTSSSYIICMKRDAHCIVHKSKLTTSPVNLCLRQRIKTALRCSALTAKRYCQ